MRRHSLLIATAAAALFGTAAAAQTKYPAVLEGHAILLLLELVDLQFGVLQAGFAVLQQLVALLELREELGQGDIARFHGLDDLLELRQGVLKGQFGG